MKKVKFLTDVSVKMFEKGKIYEIEYEDDKKIVFKTGINNAILKKFEGKLFKRIKK